MSSPVAEARWPSAGAVVAVMVLTVLMPDELRVAPTWLLLVLEAAQLLALIVADPGRIDRHSDRLRLAAIALVTVLVLSSLVATYLLIGDLIHGGEETNSATDLLEAGAFVWVSNNIAFALLYWELDGGGSAARTHSWPSGRVDLAFPQHLNPHVARSAWLPRFIDYLYLGFTNATAFSPTDVMPLVPWAKIAMAVQSTISLAILGLVIARAVNVFA
jgi:uncharacterized membrane protein